VITPLRKEQYAVWSKILDLLHEDGDLTIFEDEDLHPGHDAFDIRFMTGRVRVFVKWISEDPS